MDAKRRINRLEKATEIILQHSRDSSFSDLIEPNKDVFRGFRLVYATDNLNSNFNGISLSEIEVTCPSITKYFAASGLLFYDDELYDQTLRQGAVAFPIDYSVSFDTQVAEAFRIYEEGKDVSNWGWFENLIDFIKSRHRSFNFDYTFYILEDLINTFDHTNQRPFNTIRALKRLDHLDIEQFKSNPKKPIFNESRENSGKRAADTIASFQNSPDILSSLTRRKGLKLVLMKAMELRWLNKEDYLGNLEKLIIFCIENIGRFPKLELYFSWKLLKYGEKYRFFGHLMQPTVKAIEKLNGMSWDLYSLRHQETMASMSKNGKFYIPFIASFDRRFKELMSACPIRCMLIDDQYKRLNLMFFDEYEFFQDIKEAIDTETYSKLSDPSEKLARLSVSMLSEEMDRRLKDLETNCRLIVGA